MCGVARRHEASWKDTDQSLQKLNIWSKILCKKRLTGHYYLTKNKS